MTKGREILTAEEIACSKVLWCQGAREKTRCGERPDMVGMKTVAG